jgi:hypothetical protein
MWIAGSCPIFIAHAGQIDTTTWSNVLAPTSLAASMTVNALVTGLIVFRIFKVFREVKDGTGGRKLRSIIFIIIESGMALFAIQLARLVIATTNAEQDIYTLIVAIHEMLNVVISLIIVTLYSADNVAARV